MQKNAKETNNKVTIIMDAKRKGVTEEECQNTYIIKRKLVKINDLYIQCRSTLTNILLLLF